jgi:hypothetical protein
MVSPHGGPKRRQRPNELSVAPQPGAILPSEQEDSVDKQSWRRWILKRWTAVIWLCGAKRSEKTAKRRQSPFTTRKRLAVLMAVSATIALGKLYQIYRAETNPSPFLSSKFNHLSSKIRGVAPPSHLFSFPTPQERVQFYMGDWYNHSQAAAQWASDPTPLCRIDYWKSGMPEIGRPYRFTVRNLQDLVYQGSFQRLPWRPMRSHPGDAGLYHYVTVQQHRGKHVYGNPSDQEYHFRDKQMVLQFGDGKDSANFLSTQYPIMVKTRLAQSVYAERYGNLMDTYSPILGMYEIHRHYNDHFYETDDLWERIPWNMKRNALIWRGSSSGRRREVIEQYIDYPDRDVMDVAFSEILKVHQGKLPRPDSHYLRSEMSVRRLLSYKYLLVLEGWGMASGLKWMLYSNSVVFMAPPTKTSWAMEEKLVPYVHYVPLWQNYSNLPQQLEWARTHDEESFKIALFSRHYMERLVTSSHAHNETIEILLGIDEMYQQLYGATLQQCGKESVDSEYLS